MAVAGRESGVIVRIFLPQIDHLIERIGIIVNLLLHRFTDAIELLLPNLDLLSFTDATSENNFSRHSQPFGPNC